MLQVALLVGLLNVGFSVTYPSLSDRFDVVIDTCISNVTIDSNDQYQETGSIICRCGEYSVICFSYESNDCSGNVQETVSWGGCEQDSSTRYLYNITGCAAAQEAAAGGQCTYFVESNGWQGGSTYYGAIRPLGVCQDYNCGANSDEDSRSCMWQNDNENITYRTYSDYTCQTLAEIDNDYEYIQRIDTTSYVDCSVSISVYSLADTSYFCGSRDSKFQVKTKSSPTKNYMLKSIDSTPESIGACMSRRDGFHKYSWKYECNEDGDMVSRYVYLDSDACKGQGYIVQNYSNADYYIQCSQSKASGKYGQYMNDCSDQNWDAGYYESPKLYGECIPFRTNPVSTVADGSLYQEVPWQNNLRIVHSCAGIKGWDYDAHFFFATSDCTGDYLFSVDENFEYSAYDSEKRYPCKNTQRTKITGCSNSNIKVNSRAREYLD